VAVYENSIREALLKMKFHQDFGISEYFGYKCAELLVTLNWKFDLIIPIPLSKQRRKFRGFNQAYRLALPISLTFAKPICENGLVRNIDTQIQADLPREKRLINVNGAFLANQDLVQGKRILLVDDIATTSATMNGCSTELLAKHAACVMGITVARAVL
jgi:ComF family protein